MPPTTTTATTKTKTLARLKSLLSSTSCGGCGSRRLKLPDVDLPLPKPPLISDNHADLPESDPQPSRDPTFESRQAPRNSNSRLAETFAVVKESDDPYLDFKHSMLQMIFEKEIFEKRDLQELLACFLRLNSSCHHDSIIRAFSEIWKAVVSPSSAEDFEEREKCEEDSGHMTLEELLVEETWFGALPGEFQKPYAITLCKFVEQEISIGGTPVYPPSHLIFNALNTTPFPKVKVVILGQDPYHGPGQAMGLSFSVPEGVKIPSSLVNIFKELKQDLGCPIPSHGNLERWALQGVLLLNTVLTVRSRQANSHAKKGWEQFTDAVIRAISVKGKGVVFLLWGNSAQEKARLIDASRHHILKAAHPSGLSAHRGFFGCRHFSCTNQILEKGGETPIDWQL